MDKILTGFIYFLSYLPFWMLRGLSNFMAFVLHRIIGYRKDVIGKNLLVCFPEKTEAERKKITKEFYTNFTDTWLEAIKLLTISRKKLDEMVVNHDYEILKKLYPTGRNIQLFAGHLFNWEVANAQIPALIPYTCLSIYMPISNEGFNKMFLQLRGRFGSVMLRAGEMKKEMAPWIDKLHLIATAADQSPAGPAQGAVWLNFFGKPTAFVAGPWRQAVKLNEPIVYLSVQKPSRGKFIFKTELLIENPSSLTEGEVAKIFIERLEKDIRASPSIYLWSHKRWKFEWKDEYLPNWLGDEPPVKQVGYLK